MVSMTKKKRYSERIVIALMENFHELESTLVDANPTHMDPMYDYKSAVERIELTPMERKVFDARYPMDDVCPSSYDVADALEVSRQYVDKTGSTIRRKISSEMNRGLSDV